MNKDPGASPGANESGEITLGLLTAVEANSQLTQRSAAKELGVALGLVNAYLKRCIRKGLIKVKQAPANRYAYYVTPKGFAEKSRLTVEYLSVSLAFFRSARSQCSDLFAECVARGHTRIALAGVGELAEIATLCAGGHFPGDCRRTTPFRACPGRCGAAPSRQAPVREKPDPAGRMAGG